MSVDITSLVIKVESNNISQTASDLNKLADASDRAESATSNLGTTSRKTSSAYADGVIAADKLLATYQRQVDLLGANISQQMAYNVAMKGGNESQIQAALALGAQQDAYKRLASDQAEAIRMNKALDRSLQDVGASAGHAASGTSGITRELLVLGHEMSQGQFSRFGGSMMVLAERIDLSSGAMEGFKKVISGLTPIISALINPITLTAAAAIAVGVAVYQSSHYWHELNNALILTNNYAGATADSLSAMARAATVAGGSVGAAKESVLLLAQSGKFTAEQIQYITEAAVKLESVAGVSIKDTIKHFEDLATQSTNFSSQSTNAIAKDAIKLNETYHYLTAGIYEQIVAFEKEGDAQTAISISLQAYADNVDKQAKKIEDSLSGMMKYLHVIRDAASAMWDAISQKDSDAKLKAALQFNLKQFDAPGGGAEYASKDAAAKYRITMAQKIAEVDKRLDAQRTKDEAEQRQQRLEQERISGQARMTTLMEQYDKTNKATKDLAQFDMAWSKQTEEYRTAHLEEHSQARALIEEKTHEKIKKVKALGFADINLEISAIKSVMQAQLDSADSQIKSIKNLSDEKKINVFEEQKETNAALEMKLQAIRTGETAELTAIAGEINRKGRSATEVKELQNRYVQAYTASEKAINGVNEALNKNDKLVSILAGKAAEAQATANAKVIDSLKASTEAIQAKIDAYNRLPEIVRKAGVTDKQMQDEITQAYINKKKEELAQTIENNNVEEPIAKAQIDFLKQQIILLEIRKNKQKESEGQQAVNIWNLGAEARGKEESAEIVRQWTTAGKQIEDALTKAFDRGGKAIGGMLAAYTNFKAEQAAADERYNKVFEQQQKNPDALEAAKKIEEARQQSIHDTKIAQIHSYAEMASAAKGYFGENSRGYQILQATEKAFRAWELASNLSAFAVKSGLLTAFTSLFGIAKSAEVAATVATVPVTVAAEGVKQTALATTAMAGAIAVPFPGNLVAVGIVAAMLAAIGLGSRSGGGGAPPTSTQRQSQNGTGSVLGDSNAKSDSIQKSLDIIAKDSGLGLVHFNSMDNSLKQLVSGITGLSNLLVSGTKLTAAIPANSYNTGVAGTVVKSVMMAFGDVLGASGFIDKITGGLNTKITSAIFGGKTSVEDVGLNVGKSSLGNILQNGANVNQYTDIKKTGGWFSSDKYSTQTQSLGAEVNNQFSMVIQSLADTISASAKVLGMSGESFNEHLKSSVIDIGNISTKGLTGTQIQEALQTAFSKLGDDMAKFAIQGLDKFQKVGEGYLETVARIANDLIQVQDVFAVLGKTLNLTGVDAVNASENLIKLFGGVDKLASATKGFIDDFLTDAEKLAPVQASLNKELERLHLSTTMSADDYKKLVMSQDLTTTSGQELYAALLNLEPAFKQVTDAADAATKAAQAKADSDMKAAVDAAKNLAQNDFNVLSKAITQAKNDAQAAYNAQVAILNAQVSSLTTVKQNIDSLGAALDSALHSMTDNTVFAMSRVQAQAALDQVLNDARTTGKLPTAESMKDILSTLGKDPAAQYSNYADYIKDVGITAGKISNLSDITKGQKTVVEKQLEVAKDQLSVAKNTLDRATSGFDMLQNIAQEQLDAMNGTTVLIKDLTTAMQAFAKSVTSGTQIQAGATGSNGLPINTATTPAAMTTGVITSIYEHLLNRAPDAQGLANATDWMNHGGTALDLANNIMQSQEYKSINGSHANGLDNVPFDGYTAKLHKGEMVLPAKQAQGVVQGEDLKALIVAVQQAGTETASTQSMMQSDIRWLKKLFQQMAPSGDRLQMHDVGAA